MKKHVRVLHKLRVEQFKDAPKKTAERQRRESSVTQGHVTFDGLCEQTIISIPEHTPERRVQRNVVTQLEVERHDRVERCVPGHRSDADQRPVAKGVEIVLRNTGKRAQTIRTQLWKTTSVR